MAQAAPPEAGGQTAQQAARLMDPEEVLTYIVALASSVDGVEAVVGVHEGFTYTVHASNPDYEVYADEVAAAAVDILKASHGRILGDEPAPRVVLTEYREKGLLVADLGKDFAAAIVGDKKALTALVLPVERIVSRTPLTCPKCGAILDIYSYTCPSCGRKIPFTATVCPHCGAYTPERSCPSCGTMLRISVSRVEPAEARPAERREAAREVERRPARPAAGFSTGTAVLLGGAVTATYYLVAYAAGLTPFWATVAGAPALVATWLTLFMARRR